MLPTSNVDSRAQFKGYPWPWRFADEDDGPTVMVVRLRELQYAVLYLRVPKETHASRKLLAREVKLQSARNA